MRKMRNKWRKERVDGKKREESQGREHNKMNGRREARGRPRGEKNVLTREAEVEGRVRKNEKEDKKNNKTLERRKKERHRT